jgi:hypothetical protein
MQYFWYDNKGMQVFICKINLRKLEYYKYLTFKHMGVIYVTPIIKQGEF